MVRRQESKDRTQGPRGYSTNLAFDLGHSCFLTVDMRASTYRISKAVPNPQTKPF